MKYCPYCGATLLGGAASFCAECGRKTPTEANNPAPAQNSSGSEGRENRQPAKKKPTTGGRKPGRPAAHSGKGGNPSRRPAPSRPPKQHPEAPRLPKPDPRDEGYDGYYDDVQPIDNGHTRDRADPQLLKRAAILAAGALGIVILSVILMYLL